MDAALIKLTEQTINNNTALSAFIDKAKQQTICLMPETVQFVDPALKFGAALVSVNTAVDTYGNNKDIYKNESGSYCLHLSKINEISQHLGIQIIDSRILERKCDERGRVTFIEHQVKGRLRYVDGSVKEDVATGKYDFFRDVDSLGKGDPENKQVKGRRKHAEALAESNAKTRLFNKLNFKLPSSYTLDELKKPFLVPFIIEDKDELLKDLPKEDQMAIRKELIRKRLGIVDQIYSAPQQNQIEDAKIIDEPEVITPTETITQAEKNKITAKEYKDTTQVERTKRILELIELKGWEHPSKVKVTASMIEKSPIEKQIDRIEELLNMPDRVPVEEPSL